MNIIQFLPVLLSLQKFHRIGENILTGHRGHPCKGGNAINQDTFSRTWPAEQLYLKTREHSPRKKTSKNKIKSFTLPRI